MATTALPLGGTTCPTDSHSNTRTVSATSLSPEDAATLFPTTFVKVGALVSRCCVKTALQEEGDTSDTSQVSIGCQGSHWLVSFIFYACCPYILFPWRSKTNVTIVKIIKNVKIS